MLSFRSLNPVAFTIFSWPVYWYGLMYLVGFLSGWAILRLRFRSKIWDFSNDQVSDLVFYTALGAILGGRIGYVLFYAAPTLLSDPFFIFQTWKGGMSFHGGLLGVLIALFFYARKQHKPFLALTDFISPVVPLGLGAGRIGNFINGELWGRVADSPWGMMFPHAGPLPRYPSQLFEFALEGVLLFCILWLYSRKPRPLGAISGLFALLYALFRISVECFREPDIQIGYLFGSLTEGQLLSLPLMLVGILLLVFAYRNNKVTVK
jgi:phosphatidylglycerol---prolipoprotein diacylglyceryl transferase